MLTEAKKVGEILKIKRMEKNLSLKEVEGATSIRANYIEAIEDGSVNKFLTTVYIYGFMRQYAKFLELDIEKLARDFPEAFKMPHENHEFAYGIGTLEKRGAVSANKWKSYFLWVVGIALVLYSAYFLAKLLGVLS